jgi:diguanylate cyclase (GGDEF)-like protein
MNRIQRNEPVPKKIGVLVLAICVWCLLVVVGSVIVSDYIPARANGLVVILYILGVLVWILGTAMIFLMDRAVRIRHQANQKINEISIKDPLTGLLNRRGFTVMAEQAFRTLTREQGTAVLAFADLDRLKQLNDEQGHIEGDAALRRIGLATQEAFRVSDIVARYGGDEFVYLLVDAEWRYSNIIKERIQKTVESANLGWDRRIPIALSVGMVPIDFKDESQNLNIEWLLAQADKKMYKEKRERRSR